MKRVGILFCVFFCVFHFSALSSPEKIPPDFRLVVTGGLNGLHDGSRAFYDSSVFRLGEARGLVLDDLQPSVFRFGTTIFFSKNVFLAADVLKASSESLVRSGKGKILRGASVFAIALSDDFVPKSAINNLLRRDLTATVAEVPFEVRQFGNKLIVAVSVEAKVSVKWPVNSTELAALSAAKGHFGGASPRSYMFIGRELGATSRAFGIVDKYLSALPEITTHYVDLGDSLMSDRGVTSGQLNAMATLINARKPLVLGTGRNELGAEGINELILKDKPYIVGADFSGRIPFLRDVKIGKQVVHFAAIGEDRLSVVLPQKSKLVVHRDIVAAIAKHDAEPDLVFALTQSLETAGEVLANPIFDAVFALTSGQKGALPALDDIVVSVQNDETRSVPPLVRVSPSDVTVLDVWLENGVREQIRRLRITRIPIDENAPVAADAVKQVALFARHEKSEKMLLPIASVDPKAKVWKQENLDALFGSILLQASASELFLFEAQDRITPISESIPFDVLKILTARPGKLVTFDMRGEYLKRAFKLMTKGQFAIPIVAAGGSLSSGTISGRKIVNSEWYKVAATEKVFMVLYAFMEREGVLAEAPVRSSLVENYVGDVFGLNVLKNVRLVGKEAKVSGGAELALSAPSVSSKVDAGLEREMSAGDIRTHFRNAKGAIRPTIAFDIENLDLGFNMNVQNQTTRDWNTASKSDPNRPKDEKFDIPDSQLTLPEFIHLLANAKASLNFTSYHLDSSLIGGLRFFSTRVWDDPKRSGGKPEKDKVSAQLEFRLPVERWIERYQGGFFVTPLTYLAYETKIFPVSFLTRTQPDQWEAAGFERPHLGKYFLGVVGKPFLNGDVRLGGILFYNFNFASRQPDQALDYGAEISTSMGTNIGPLGLEGSAFLDLLWPTASHPREDKLGLISQIEGRAVVARFGDFSISLLADVYLGTTMVEPNKPGVRFISGIAASYGQRFKWLL